MSGTKSKQTLRTDIFRYQQEEEKDQPHDNNDEFKNKEIFISFPDQEVRISKREYRVYQPFHDNETVMRLLTGQLKDEAQNTQNDPQSQAQNDQMDAFQKLFQGNLNPQNMGNFANMQNLMNNPALASMMSTQGIGNNANMNTLMASMMGMGGQNQPNLMGMGSNSQSTMHNSQQMSQNDFLNQLMASQMSPGGGNFNWNMANMQNMGGNLGNMDKQSLNDMISSQMMNFNNAGNGGFMGGQQDQNQNMNQMNQNPNYQNQNQ